MPKVRTLLGMAWVLFGVAVAGYAVNVLRPRDATFHHKPVRYWIDELCSGNTERKARAREAFRAMGPPALEPLLQMVRARDSALNSWLAQVAQKYPVFDRAFASADAQHCKAVVAFGALGSIAEPAIPALARLIDDPDACVDAIWALCAIGRNAAAPLAHALKNPDSEVRERAVCFLRTMGAEATDALPDLAGLVHDEDETVRMSAVVALGTLGKICQKQDLVVLAMTECFQDPNANVRRTAALSLAHYGPHARPAMATLTMLLDDPNPGVRLAARASLGRLEMEIETSGQQIRDASLPDSAPN